MAINNTWNIFNRTLINSTLINNTKAKIQNGVSVLTGSEVALNFLILIFFLLLFIVMILIARRIIIFLKNIMKGGKKRMGRPKNKNAKKSEDFDDEDGDDLDEGFIDDLDDDEDDEGGEEDESTEGIIDNKTIKRLDKLETDGVKIEKAISVNQKYIKKIWSKVKELEENFTRLIDESK